MPELLNPEGLLQILEGNRRLTVRVVEAFPEEALFSFKPVEPLRPFAEMVKEIIGIERAYVHGIATGEWVYKPVEGVTTKAALLNELHAVREYVREVWPRVTVERLLAAENDHFFVEMEQENIGRIFYALENEIHHRGQGYIYLRLLGIEPPAFYER
jgi:uncharacterized damage-inducible protein DinB